MQARATALVHAAFQDGLAPLAISLEEIADASRKPSLSELRAVLDLHHLVQCVEVRYCHLELPGDYFFWSGWYTRWPNDRKPPPPINTPEEPEGMGIWRERFHAAAYTTLLMGAVLARAYNQPFYPDMTQTSPSDEEADAYRCKLSDLMRKASVSRGRYLELGINDEEREYLRRFPVFDLNDELEAQKETFSPFIEWFIKATVLKHRAGPPLLSRDLLRDEVRAANRLERPGDGMGYVLPTECTMRTWPETGGMSQWFTGGSPEEGEAVLWLIMQSIHMFEFILTCMVNSDGQRRFGRRWVKDAGSFSGKKTRTAKVVLFGVFQVEEILMPDDVTDSAGQQLLAHTPRSPVTVPPPVLDIPLVLEDLYLRSGIPNTIESDYNTPPPPLQLFTFTLRHHFDLQFHLAAFTTDYRDEQDYHRFKSRATIFANDRELVPEREWGDYTNGTEYLVEYQPGWLSFESDGYNNYYPGVTPRTFLPICYHEDGEHGDVYNTGPRD